jgi:V8-like Glu-specific endopeptidase
VREGEPSTLIYRKEVKMADEKKDMEHQSVSSEEGGGTELEGESGLSEDNGTEFDGEEFDEDQEDDAVELFEDESEGEDESMLEDVPGFNEETLETDVGEGADEFTPEEWDQLPECGAENYEAPESVCGRDDRVRIRTTTRLPWRWSCQLIITARNGRRGRCTGWLIGPRTAVTAGHCVYSHAAGGWARSIEVIPGMDSSRRPFGSMVGTSFRSVRGWTSSRNAKYDYGAIILPRCNFKNLGYFGFASLPSSALRNLVVNNAGYAGDKPFGTLWFNAGRIRSVTSRRLYYMIDTYGGHSGSCVWLLRRIGGRTQRYGLGIHGYGGCPNKAVRIVKPVFDNLKRWKTEGRC